MKKNIEKTFLTAGCNLYRLPGLWATTIVVLIISLIVSACHTKGEEHMKGPTAIQELRSLSADDFEGTSQLAERIKTESLEAPKALVHLWLRGEKSDSQKAIDIILDLEELTLRPVLESLDNNQPLEKIKLMSLAVDSQLSLREAVVTKLNQMLNDKTPVPLYESVGPVEEKEVPRRVCDEAYLLMRRLLKFNEDEVYHGLNASEFLELSDDEKDLEIIRAMNTKTWTNWIEEED